MPSTTSRAPHLALDIYALHVRPPQQVDVRSQGSIGRAPLYPVGVRGARYHGQGSWAGECGSPGSLGKRGARELERASSQSYSARNCDIHPVPRRFPVARQPHSHKRHPTSHQKLPEVPVPSHRLRTGFRPFTCSLPAGCPTAPRPARWPRGYRGPPPGRISAQTDSSAAGGSQLTEIDLPAKSTRRGSCRLDIRSRCR